MSLRENATREFNQSPIVVTATLCGLIIAALALLIGWLSYSGAARVAGQVAPVATQGKVGFNLANMLILLAFFIAATGSLSSLIRFLARYHAFAAVVLSIPVASLAIFGTLVMAKLVPPRQVTPSAEAMASNAAYWGVVFIFIAINGLPAMRSFATGGLKATSTQGDEAKTKDENDGLGLLTAMMLIALFWGGLIAKGQTLLVGTFLQ